MEAIDTVSVRADKLRQPPKGRRGQKGDRFQGRKDRYKAKGEEE